MKKRILCFGDSNTWGFDPAEDEKQGFHSRFPWNVRYPGALQTLLGETYCVIEEGHNGRTSVWDDPMMPYRNGMKYIEACLETHTPLDLVLIMIGTNDMKPRVSGRAFDSAEGVRALVKKVKQNACGHRGGTPQILVVSPVTIGKNIATARFGNEFGANCREESLLLPVFLKKVAEEEGCAFLNAAEYAVVAGDEIHIDADGHAKLAQAFANTIKTML